MTIDEKAQFIADYLKATKNISKVEVNAGEGIVNAEYFGKPFNITAKEKILGFVSWFDYENVSLKIINAANIATSIGKVCRMNENFIQLEYFTFMDLVNDNKTKVTIDIFLDDITVLTKFLAERGKK